MNLYFWQNIPSIHQSDLISEVAKKWDGNVFVITEANIPTERSKQGWYMPSYSPAKLIVNPTGKKRIDIINKSLKEDTHIFSGIGSYNKTQKTLDLIIARGSTVGIYAESPRDNEGIKSSLRKIKYKYLAFKYKNSINFFLLTGAKAIDYFKKAGFKEDTFFDFGYFISNNASIDDNDDEMNNKIRLIYIGSLIERKGIDILFGALSKLPPHYLLDIIGGGVLKKNLMRLADELSITNRLIWHGEIKNIKIYQYIKKSDYLILPSHFDGWGVVVNEALVLGTPVIVSDACGSSDMIVSNLQGSIFQSGSIKSLYEKLVILKKPTLVHKNELKQWSLNSIHPNVVANYFTDIIKLKPFVNKTIQTIWKNY